MTVTFGIRDIEQRDAVLTEFHRVLRPGGALLLMEFGVPDIPVLGRGYHWYFDHVLPPLGN